MVYQTLKKKLPFIVKAFSEHMKLLYGKAGKNSTDKDTKLSAVTAKVLAKKVISRYTELMRNKDE